MKARAVRVVNDYPFAVVWLLAVSLLVLLVLAIGELQ